MGNSQSFTITHPETDHIEKKDHTDQPNGHPVSGLDLTDAVTSEVSVQQNTEPVTVTCNVTPTQASIQTNGTQTNAPSAETVSATAGSGEKDVPADSSTAAKNSPKQTPSKFNMMFKKKIAPAEVTIVPALETERHKSIPTAASVETDGVQANVQISSTTISPEKATPAESGTAAKDTAKQAGTPSKFNMMFKKKAEAAEVAIVDTESQKSPPAASIETNGTPTVAPTVSMDAAGIQISAAGEKDVPADSRTAAKNSPKQTPSKFNMMFKKKSAPAEVTIVPALETEISTPTSLSVESNGTPTVAPTVSVDAADSSTAAKNSLKQTPSKFNLFKKKSALGEVTIAEAETQKPPPAASIETNGTPTVAPTVSVDAAGIQISAAGEKDVPADSRTAAKNSPKQTPSKFNMMFKKKSAPAEVTIVPALETEISEPTDIKASPQSDEEPQGEALEPSTAEVTRDSTTQAEQTGAEEKSVMNFFKTFVTSTKTTKEATPSLDVAKEQSQKETPPAPAANVQEALKAPPPPPPAPPKMEGKAEPAVKKEEAPAVEVAAAPPKEPEAQSKAKAKDSPFSKLFRSKSGVKEEAKPVEIQVDASKARTLEASAKPEPPPPAPKAEEKKAEKKPSPFANLLKPKVLLGQVSAKIHSAASSATASISLGAGAAATESKKETPAAPTAPADAAPSAKAKEEPKPAAPAAPAAASADDKSVGSTDNPSPTTSRKLEKRNSIHLFFKNLGQKRHSDAEVQTEPVAAEKAK